MLDVHPPHTPTHSWKDFFIHVGTIVIGLLIAVGLEQTVEYVHHRHQLAEAREALRAERRISAEHFAVQTREFHRFIPRLKTDLAILMFLKEHPHAPASQWPGRFDWLFLSTPYFDNAWTSAKQDGVLELMPPSERNDDDELTHRLAGLTVNMEQRRRTTREAQSMWIQTPDPSRMSSQQIDLAIAAVTEALGYWYESARLQQGFRWPDFNPRPTDEDMRMILPPLSTDPESIRAFTEARREVGAVSPESTTEFDPK